MKFTPTVSLGTNPVASKWVGLLRCATDGEMSIRNAVSGEGCAVSVGSAGASVGASVADAAGFAVAAPAGAVLVDDATGAPPQALRAIARSRTIEPNREQDENHNE